MMARRLSLLAVSVLLICAGCCCRNSCHRDEAPCDRCSGPAVTGYYGGYQGYGCFYNQSPDHSSDYARANRYSRPCSPHGYHEPALSMPWGGRPGPAAPPVPEIGEQPAGTPPAVASPTDGLAPVTEEIIDTPMPIPPTSQAFPTRPRVGDPDASANLIDDPLPAF